MSEPVRVNHQFGFLSGNASSETNPNNLPLDRYDLVILTVSWDERCLVIPQKMSVSTDEYILVKFDLNANPVTNETFLQQYIGNHPKKIIAGEARAPEEHFNKLFSAIEELRIRKGRPLTVLFDLSPCLPYLALGFVGCGIGNGIFRKIDYLYAEADYDPGEEKKPEFTGGKWRLAHIPGYFRFPEEALKDHFIVSVGWEGNKTLKVVSKSEPSRISVLFPDPGYLPSYPYRTMESNKGLFDMYCISNDMLIRATAGNAIEGWLALETKQVERTNENVYYVVSGNKPHALSMALRAKCTDKNNLICPIPEKYTPNDVTLLDKFWLYSIEDKTILTQV